MSNPARTPTVPRPSATLLVVRDDPFEVLMVRRANRGAFASALVFPGGVIEPADGTDVWLPHLDGAEGLVPEERARRIAAIRETFEETAILLAADAGGACPPIADPTGRAFLDLVRDHGLRLDLDAIVPFAHWITPEVATRRYDTHFYVARAPRDGEAACDGAETVALEWTSPHDLLARAAAGEDSIIFPTRMNIARLAETEDVGTTLAAAARRPLFTVLPRAERRGDEMVFIIPPEAGYPETENFQPHVD